MTVPEKLRMAAKLVELGVDILEAGFPIASEGDSEAVDAISREFPWAHVAALARASRPDIEAAIHSLRNAKRPRIHTLATSDIHLKYKLKKSRQQVLDDVVAAVTLARQHCDDGGGHTPKARQCGRLAAACRIACGAVIEDVRERRSVML